MRSIATSRRMACTGLRGVPPEIRYAGWAVRALSGGACATVLASVSVSSVLAQTADTPLSQAQEFLATGDIAAASFKALMILFVLAVLIESALAVIFNWRLFLELFNGRGVKTLVAIAVSAVVVSTFGIDRHVFERLLTVYGVSVGEGGRTVSLVLTSLILAGGSGGVHRILVALGYRDPIPDKPKVMKAPKGRAWIAVRVDRKEAVGPIEVHVQQGKARDENSPAELAGVIAPVGFWYRLWSIFFLDRNRFPQAGGHDVLPGFEYAIRVDARNRAGEPLDCALNHETYCFADGAIVDFGVVL